MTAQAGGAVAPAAQAASADRGRRKVEVGLVTSTKMQKTIAVSVDRIVRHGKFEKQLTRQTVHKAHDEKGEAKLGDLVEIIETRPLSKTKRWRLVKIVRKSTMATVTGAIAEAGDASKVKGGMKGKAKDEAPAKAAAPKAEKKADAPAKKEKK